jgi:uncharacterized protein (TIGR02300 family)
MNKPELGVKRDCPNCGARFYDLSKSPAHCPKCQHVFVPEALLKPRKPRREDEPVEEAPAPVAEAPLVEADKEGKGAKSKKKPALDQDAPADPDAIEDIEDLDVDIDEDDDTLLEEEEDDDDDLSDVVSGGEGDED